MILKEKKILITDRFLHFAPSISLDQILEHAKNHDWKVFEITNSPPII